MSVMSFCFSTNHSLKPPKQRILPLERLIYDLLQVDRILLFVNAIITTTLV